MLIRSVFVSSPSPTTFCAPPGIARPDKCFYGRRGRRFRGTSFPSRYIFYRYSRYENVYLDTLCDYCSLLFLSDNHFQVDCEALGQTLREYFTAMLAEKREESWSAGLDVKYLIQDLDIQYLSILIIQLGDGNFSR